MVRHCTRYVPFSVDIKFSICPVKLGFWMSDQLQSCVRLSLLQSNSEKCSFVSSREASQTFTNSIQTVRRHNLCRTKRRRRGQRDELLQLDRSEFQQRLLHHYARISKERRTTNNHEFCFVTDCRGADVGISVNRRLRKKCHDKRFREQSRRKGQARTRTRFICRYPPSFFEAYACHAINNR